MVDARMNTLFIGSGQYPEHMFTHVTWCETGSYSKWDFWKDLRVLYVSSVLHFLQRQDAKCKSW